MTITFQTRVQQNVLSLTSEHIDTPAAMTGKEFHHGFFHEEVETFNPMSIPEDFTYTLHRQGTLLHSVSGVRAICPYCRNASTFTVKGCFFREGRGEVRTQIRLILDCNYLECKQVVFVFIEMDQSAGALDPENTFYMYPSRAIAPRHAAVPVKIAADWEEAQRAADAGAMKAAAVMLRSVLYGVLLDKHCTLVPLHQGLQELIDDQRLPVIFDEWLPAIKDDMPDGSRPDRALNVSADNIHETMDYTFALLRFVYIEPHEFRTRRRRIEAPLAEYARTAASRSA
jgi:hypothetical protein